MICLGLGVVGIGLFDVDSVVFIIISIGAVARTDRHCLNFS